MKKRKRKKLLSLLLKISLSSFLVIIVLKKINIEKLAILLKSADYSYFIGAFVVMMVAQVFGALRMSYNLEASGLVVSKMYSLHMYFIGTLFNIILPGGIGGEGYKAYYFHKRFRYPWKEMVRVVLRGRAGGLLFLCLFLFIFSFFYMDHLKFIPYTKQVLIAAIILIFPAYSICAKIFLQEKLETQLGAIKYSLTVQLLNLLAIWFILHGIGNYGNIIGYIVVFLVANIVSIIPISFAGVGIREFTYVTLAQHMSLSSDVGVAASLLFYLIYLVVAFFGFIPYFNLRNLDARELRYQRNVTRSKYKIVDEDISQQDKERISADGS